MQFSFYPCSCQASEKPSQSAKQTSEPPAKKRKRKEKKPPGKAKGALSLLIQYDSDSTSSCGTHTESDDSSGHSSSPVSGTPSPVVVETSSDPSRFQSLGAALPEQRQEVSANSVAQVNGGVPKSGGGTTHKKRSSNGKSPVEKKKPRKGGNSRNEPHPPLVNLNDTVVSMQQLKGVAPNAPMPSNYQAYSSAYAAYATPGNQYSAPGVAGYALPSFSLPAGSLNFPPPGHPQYAASLPQYYTGEAHPTPPGYSASPGGYFPQWRTSYAPMKCQGAIPPTFNFANSGNNGNNVYR